MFKLHIYPQSTDASRHEQWKKELVDFHPFSAEGVGFGGAGGGVRVILFVTVPGPSRDQWLRDLALLRELRVHSVLWLRSGSKWAERQQGHRQQWSAYSSRGGWAQGQFKGLRMFPKIFVGAGLEERNAHQALTPQGRPPAPLFLHYPPSSASLTRRGKVTAEDDVKVTPSEKSSGATCEGAEEKCVQK
ncbi:unnamed protein product [Gadus morhua 'NCC']